MDIREISNEEYRKLVLNPFCRFNKAEFYALNAHKVDKVHYLIFNDGKDRLALVCGVKDEIAKAPFSASFEAFSEISQNNKIIHYHDAVKALVQWCKDNGIKQFRMSLPMPYYKVAHVSKMANALFANGFKCENTDVNFDYYLSDFKDTYEMDIDIKARQKLRASIKHNLTFEKTDDVQTVYSVIKQNREEKGYSLWLSYDDVINTAKIIPSDFFLVRDESGAPIASALIHQINNEILRVVYWGNTQNSNHLCPMNFLSYNVFKYYSTTQFKIVDVGPATDDSIPNYGLCDFKEGIGCKCSLKLTYLLEL